MSSLIERIYFNSPVWLQNLAVTAMGYKLYRERYSKLSESFFQQLLKTQGYSGTELMGYQEQSFVRLARHAIINVPYYRDWAKASNIDANDIRSLKDLNVFPVLEKELVRSRPDYFIAEGYGWKSGVFQMSTSGTTGAPLKVFCDKKSRSNHYAFFSRLRHNYGLTKESKRATLFGRIIMPGSHNKPPFWRYDLAQKNLLMSSYHLAESNVMHYYRKLLQYKPDEIFSYPSSILPIARYINESNLPPLKLKLLMTTAEPLYEYQREQLARAFDAPIVNQYGCTEMAFFASGEHESLFLHPEHGIAEVEVEGGDVRTSGEGEFIATGLVNYVMPLIRYRVGDSIVLNGIKPNEKGAKAYSEISSFTGRTDDLLYKKDGTPVGRLDPVFKGGANINAAQIIQTSSEAVEVIIEPSEEFSQKDKERLEYELRKRLGDDMDISITTDKKILKLPNGKFKAVVNNARQ